MIHERRQLPQGMIASQAFIHGITDQRNGQFNSGRAIRSTSIGITGRDRKNKKGATRAAPF